MKKLKLAFVIFLGLAAITLAEYKYFDRKLSAHKKKTTRRLKACEDIAKGLPLQTPNLVFFPKQFENLPLENKGMVLGSKKIEIRNVAAPYNPSIIEYGDGYLVFFRYDIVKQMHLNLFHTYIGCAELDRNFNQTEKEFVTIDTQSPFCEDPRVLNHNGQLSLIYNNLLPAKFHSRAMHIARVNLNASQVEAIQKIDLHLRPIEKNWAPFIYTNADGSEEILFEYLVMHPRQILKYSSEETPEWIEPTASKEEELWCTNWEKKWGPPLGGTGARLVDGQYLSFFHSKFKAEDKTWWYVMGAYTFEAKPPFRITGVSTNPIFFEGIYETPALNTASPDKFVIFPCGFALEEKNGKTLVHLSCGENDSAMKIITLDKDALLKSLKKL